MDTSTVVWLIIFYVIGVHPITGITEKGGATYASATEKICNKRRDRFMIEAKTVSDLKLWIVKDCFPFEGTPTDYENAGIQEAEISAFRKALEQ